MAASITYNNPLAAWPDSTGYSWLFGSTGYGVIGGNNQIANFSTPQQGAAANVAVMSRQYGNSTVGEMLSKWTGGNPYSVPGVDANAKVNDVLNSSQGPMLLSGMARNEAGAGVTLPLSEQDWGAAISQGLAAAGTPGTVGAATAATGASAGSATSGVFDWAGHQIVRVLVVLLGFIFVAAGLGVFALGTLQQGAAGSQGLDLYEGSLRRRMYKGAATGVSEPVVGEPVVTRDVPAVPRISAKGREVAKPWGSAPVVPKDPMKVRTKPGRPRKLNPEASKLKATVKRKPKAKPVDVPFEPV
jgi:hypothetical protein